MHCVISAPPAAAVTRRPNARARRMSLTRCKLCRRSFTSKAEFSGSRCESHNGEYLKVWEPVQPGVVSGKQGVRPTLWLTPGLRTDSAREVVDLLPCREQRGAGMPLWPAQG